MSRGFAAIALDNPKCLANVGGVLRAAGCYSAALVVIGGKRIPRLGGLVTDTMKAWKSTPVVMVDDPFSAIPYDCVPVAIDLVEDAQDLSAYKHPERAFYVFGPEDGTLGKRVLDRCRDRVAIATSGCMNLAATVNVVLYDRLAKRGAA